MLRKLREVTGKKMPGAVMTKRGIDPVDVDHDDRCHVGWRNGYFSFETFNIKIDRRKLGLQPTKVPPSTSHWKIGHGNSGHPKPHLDTEIDRGFRDRRGETDGLLLTLTMIHPRQKP